MSRPLVDGSSREKVHSTYGNLDKLLFLKYLNILICDDLEFVKKEIMNLGFFL